MAKQKKKQPRVSKLAPELGKKTVKSQPPPSFNEMQLSWGISLIEMEGPFGWGEVEKSKLDDIRKKFGEFEKLYWNEIQIEQGDSHHKAYIYQISLEAQERLKEIRLDDEEELFSLRLSGKERVWGIRREAKFLILWWDPDHKVRPSVKKHT